MRCTLISSGSYSLVLKTRKILRSEYVGQCVRRDGVLIGAPPNGSRRAGALRQPIRVLTPAAIKKSPSRVRLKSEKGARVT